MVKRREVARVLTLVRATMTVLWVFLPGAGGVASAEGPRAAESIALFEQGLEAARRESWHEAVSSFERSCALVERPGTVYNLILAYDKLGKPLSVLRMVQRFMTISDPVRHAAERRQLLEAEAGIYRQLARVDLMLSPSESAVTVDNEPPVFANDARTLLLAPGRRELAIHAPGYVPQIRLIDVAAETSATLSVRLSRVVEPRGLLALSVSRPSPSPRESDRTGSALRRGTARAFAFSGALLWAAAVAADIVAVHRAATLASRDPEVSGYLTASERFVRAKRAVLPLSLTGGALVTAGSLVHDGRTSPKAPPAVAWSVFAAGLAMTAVGAATWTAQPELVGRSPLTGPRREHGMLVYIDRTSRHRVGRKATVEPLASNRPRLATLLLSALLATAQACTDPSFCPDGTRSDSTRDRCAQTVDATVSPVGSDASSPLDAAVARADASDGQRPPSPPDAAEAPSAPDGKVAGDAAAASGREQDAALTVGGDASAPNDASLPAKSGVYVQLTSPSPGKVSYQVSNRSGRAVRLSGWKPSSNEQLVSVSKQGEAVTYVGPVVARVASAASNSWVLAPNESLTQEIDVAADFEVKQGGSFEVRPSARSSLAIVDGDVGVSLEASVTLIIPADLAAAKQPLAAPQATRWEGCNTEQQQALHAANVGLNWMTTHREQEWANEDALRRTWFGTLPSGDSLSMTTKVQTPLHQIRELSASETTSFVCVQGIGACADPSTYAFVSSADATALVPRVQLCPAYWLFAHDGGDAEDGVSRVGGLGHAYALFFVGPGDHTFGERACRELATSEPARARVNPDNLRFYVMGRQ